MRPIDGFVADTQFSVAPRFLSPSPVDRGASRRTTEGATIYYTTRRHGALGGQRAPLRQSRDHRFHHRSARASPPSPRYLSAPMSIPRPISLPATSNSRSRWTRASPKLPDYIDEIERALGKDASGPFRGRRASEPFFRRERHPHPIYDRSGRAAEVPISLEYFSPTLASDTFHIRAGHPHPRRATPAVTPRNPFGSISVRSTAEGEANSSIRCYEGSNVNSFEQLVLRSCGHDSWSLADRFGGSDFRPPGARLLSPRSVSAPDGERHGTC